MLADHPGISSWYQSCLAACQPTPLPVQSVAGSPSLAPQSSRGGSTAGTAYSTAGRTVQGGGSTAGTAYSAAGTARSTAGTARSVGGGMVTQTGPTAGTAKALECVLENEGLQVREEGRGAALGAASEMWGERAAR